MKPVIRILAAGLACCLGSAAHAAVVTYAFQAKVSRIVENASEGAPFVEVEQSGYAGTPVALGDIVNGSFQYDTSVGLSSYQPDQPPGVDYRMYDSGANDYISYIDRNTGLAFNSLTSQNWLGNAVYNSAPASGGYASDFFSMRRNAIDDYMGRGASIWLDDLYGNAFQSAAMPTQLSLADFQFASVEGSFLRLRDGAFMYFTADLTSLERVEVPEPDSAALFAIAAGGLFGLRRMRHAAGRPARTTRVREN